MKKNNDVISFNRKKYKTFQTLKDLLAELLLINNKLITVKLTVKFCQNKISKKPFLLLLNKSIFKNFENMINGNLFFTKTSQKHGVLKETNHFKKKDFKFFKNALTIKLNKKFHYSKVFFKLNFLTYKENFLLLFQIKIIQIKKFQKVKRVGFEPTVKKFQQIYNLPL